MFQASRPARSQKQEEVTALHVAQQAERRRQEVERKRREREEEERRQQEREQTEDRMKSELQEERGRRAEKIRSVCSYVPSGSMLTKCELFQSLA